MAHKRTPVETVDVPEWGGTVYLTPMNGHDRFSFYRRCTEMGDKESATATLLVRTVTDSEGKRLFTDEDEQAVANLHGHLLDRFAGALTRVNALGSEGHEDAKKN